MLIGKWRRWQPTRRGSPRSWSACPTPPGNSGESEERYRSVIDAQGDLVVRRDGDGRVTFVSPAFASTFGLDAEAAIGRPLHFGPAKKPMFDQDVMAAEVAIATGDSPRWYSWLDIPVRDAKGKLGPHYSVARDITARKQGRAGP